MLKLETIYSQYCARLAPLGITPASVKVYCQTVYEEQDHFVFAGFKFGQNRQKPASRIVKPTKKRTDNRKQTL